MFKGIYSDLFPGIALPEPDRDELVESLQIYIEKRNLQGTPWFMEKIIQVYEMILVRHGLMIVGLSMGGKTCAYQVFIKLTVISHSFGMINLHQTVYMYKIEMGRACSQNRGR